MSWKERMIKLCGQLRPWLPALALAAVAMTPNLAFALATPVDGDFGYDVYGIMVNKGLKGPLGNAVVVGGVVIGAAFGFQQKMQPALTSMGAGAVIGKSPAIVSSFGVTLQMVGLS